MNPGDQETRARVLNPEQSFIVQAPAGSGKTELLVRRYLGLLAVVDAPEEIIAITFTRKAAAEMRKMIIDALKPVQDTGNTHAHSPDASTQIRRKLAGAALARSQELNWQLTQNPARIRIMTIDSFCTGLTQQMPLLSELGGQPEIIEDAGDLYREAAADTLKQLDEDEAPEGGRNSGSAAVETLLAHLDNNLPQARDMLVAMLGKRDQWLRHLAGRRPDRGALEDVLKHVVEAALENALGVLPQEHTEELAACLRYAAHNHDDPACLIEQLPGTGCADPLPDPARRLAQERYCQAGIPPGRSRKTHEAPVSIPVEPVRG